MSFKYMLILFFSITLFSCFQDEEIQSEIPLAKCHGYMQLNIPRQMELNLEMLLELEATSKLNENQYPSYYSTVDSTYFVFFSRDEQYDYDMLFLYYSEDNETRLSRNIKSNHSMLSVLEYELKFLMSHGIIKDSVEWRSMVLSTIQKASENDSGNIASIQYNPDRQRSIDIKYSDSLLGDTISHLAFDPPPSLGYATRVVGACEVIDVEMIKPLRLVSNIDIMNQ